jgi:hypothetical protein
MEFFFPSPDGNEHEDPVRAEELWQACRKGAETETGWEALARRVYRLRYRHNGQTMEAKVGEREDYYERERVMALIAFPNCYKICCMVRGFMKVGDTPMVGLGDVLDVEDFDG